MGKTDKQVLKRYLENCGSEEDENLIRQWMDNADTETEIDEESYHFWSGINPEQNIAGFNGDQMLDRIHHKIKIEEARFMDQTNRTVPLTGYLVRIAATLFIPLLIASMLFYFQNISLRNATSWAEIIAPYGTRTNFSLPDGSTGWLNGGSSLKFQSNFEGRIRDVQLKGEAYFDVVSNKRKPFIVSTRKIKVVATGTSFNVMAYEDQSMEVTLKSGKVEVVKIKDDLSLGVLKPDEALTYFSSQDSVKIQTVNSAEKLAWIEGKLIFKYEPFREVINKINRFYNVNISMNDKSLDSYIYYGTFQDETLEEVLKLLQYTAPIRYRDLEREKREDGTFEKRKIEIYYKE